jgi:hypothetical protein
VNHLYIPFVIGKQFHFFLRQTHFRKKLSKLLIVDSNQPIAVIGNLRCSVRREIKTETEENLRTLLQFVPFGHFMDTELFPAYAAFPPSISQCTQFGPHAAIRA